MFSCEHCEIFKDSFLWNTFCSLYFDVMIEFFGYKIDVLSYFLCYCFVFLHHSSLRIGSPSLFRTCFYTKKLVSVTFTHTLQRRPQHYCDWIAKNQKYLQNFSDCFQNSIMKNVNLSFLNIMLYSCISLEAVLLSWPKIT